MLRNRSRTVTSKPSLMADHNSVPSPRPNQTTPVSSFFGSPRFLNGFFTKGVTDFESVMSPTSIVDSKKIQNFGNPFGYDQNQSISPKKSTENKHLNEILDCKRIGLALIDSLNDEKNLGNFNSIQQKSSRKVLFGSKLKVQIPIILSPSAISPTQSPKSPADFGIKTRNSQFLGNSTPFGGLNSGVQAKDSPKISTGGLSLREMELSEDYTCVISRGPNPKTTRIFDNCIVESCCGVVAVSDLKKEYNLNSPSQSFLSFCHTCKKNLGEGKDIYMYRLVQIHLFLEIEIFISIQNHC